MVNYLLLLILPALLIHLAGCTTQQDMAAAGSKLALAEFPAGEKLILRINCGGDLADSGWQYKDRDGNIWLMDQPLKAGGQWGVEGGAGCFRGKLEISGKTPFPQVYLAERYDMKRYHFALPAGTYAVRLHFAETFTLPVKPPTTKPAVADNAGTSNSDIKPGDRVFDVSLGKKTILTDFDVLKEAGGFATPLVKEFDNVEVGPDGLDISFTKKTQAPIINGIEIIGKRPLEKPFCLYSNPPQSSEKNQPMPAPPGEVLYRIICGAKLPEGYVYRIGKVEWLPGQEMTDGRNFGAVGGGSCARVGSIDFPGTEFPGVYRFERYNLERYEFRLSDGKYAIRLHFAESFESNFKPGSRIFDVTVNGKKVLTDFDPLVAGGGWARPSVVEVDGINVSDGLLKVAFTAKMQGQSPAICGIEVFRATSSQAEKTVRLTTPAKPLDVGKSDPSRPVKKVLFVGHSFFFFWAMPETIATMVNTGQKDIQLEPHRYLQGGKLLPWFLYGDPSKGAIKLIETGKYDYVAVMAHCISPDVVKAIDEFGRLIKAAGARMVIHYVDQPPTNDDGKKLFQEVLDLARKYDAIFLPVGATWSAGMKERPDLTWKNTDSVHPSLHMAYLAACIHYIAWTGKSPVGHPYPYVVNLGCRVDGEAADYLQKLAWRIYNQYKKDYGICGADEHYPQPATQP